MPIDEGVNVDLQFLVLEVKKQARASLSYLERPTRNKLKRIREREDYVDNLKNTLVNKSYFQIHRLADDDRQVNYFKALITVAGNLERISDLFENICDQVRHFNDPEFPLGFELKRYYREFYRALDMTYPALTELNLTLAQSICDSEQLIDDLYDESFMVVRRNLRQRRDVDDSLTLLFILRYLERVGDAFLNIGEAVLNIHLGEQLGIRQFRNLMKGLARQGIDIREEVVEFNSVMNTRSGSRVGTVIVHNNQAQRSFFYKEGARDKIDEEAKALAQFQRVGMVKVPAVLWHQSKKKYATLLLEYIEGHDLLELLINQRARVGQALDLLASSMVSLWDSTRRKKTVRSDHIAQLVSRTDDIVSVHGQLFNLEANMGKMLKDAKKLERTLKAPFSTLIHGDFNVDNIIFGAGAEDIWFVDVHRSRYGDYAQDVSVFLVSNFRVPIFSADIRQRLNEANMRMFECAVGYADSQGDTTFHARLALGLFRSLVTSTRFMFDEGFSTNMFMRGTSVLHELLEHKDDVAGFRLSQDYFLYR
ncbi:MAG: PhoU domain-containing protein [Pseudomonadota bacterium]